LTLAREAASTPVTPATRILIALTGARSWRPGVRRLLVSVVMESSVVSMVGAGLR